MIPSAKMKQGLIKMMRYYSGPNYKNPDSGEYDKSTVRWLRGSLALCESGVEYLRRVSGENRSRQAVLQTMEEDCQRLYHFEKSGDIQEIVWQVESLMSELTNYMRRS